jgi:hypothetical protein
LRTIARVRTQFTIDPLGIFNFSEQELCLRVAPLEKKNQRRVTPGFVRHPAIPVQSGRCSKLEKRGVRERRVTPELRRMSAGA